MPDQLSSTAQDLARGRRSEIDHLNGYVARRGEALGIATPVNRALHAVVKLLEDAPRADARVDHAKSGPQRAADGI
jgi:2-dehydropantoate 2-reductase